MRKELIMDESKLLEIIAEFTTYGPEELKENMNFSDDLGIDSLDLAQIIMAVEDAYDVELDEEALDSIQTVGDAINMVKNN
ncbi:MAG: acyl carrier protein [Firmicutes bacterium HGW-Firmicutes-2]|jgi:acyl carrier protein|nr:MAG: acyl carrier protein [Firmicutes bacterium HGW-Firmicutes-2]